MIPRRLGVPVVHDVMLSAPADPYLSLKAAAAYTSLSVRTLRGYIDLPPDQALRATRLPGGGKIIVRRSDIDTWLEQFTTRGRPSLAAALHELGLVKRA